MNNLEDFIRKHRAAFDHLEPRERLWGHIASDLDKDRRDYGWLWKAAVVALLAACGYLLWERSQERHLEASLADEYYAGTEFIETELYYTQLIAEQKLMVEEFDLDDRELKKSFKRDLASLDTAYQELKLEYVETGNEVVLEAMIGNLQLRTELLNQQLSILEQIENEDKNETHKIHHL